MNKNNESHKDRLVSFNKSKFSKILTNAYDGVTTNILGFVAKSKYTSAHNISMLLDSKNIEKDIEFIDYLIEQNLLLKREIVFGPDLYALTAKGAKLMGVKTFRVNQVNLWAMSHALIAQSETILAMKQFKLIKYEFEPNENHKNTRPDVILVYLDDISSSEIEMRVEIELTEKSMCNGKMAMFFEKIFSQPTIVVFNDRIIMDKYWAIAEKYWQNGLPIWRSIDCKLYNTGTLHKVTTHEMLNVSFKMVGEKISNSHKLIGRVIFKKR